MNKFRTLLSLIIYTLLLCNQSIEGQLLKDGTPFVGGQIFIEPGLSSGRIDTLFLRMKENHMTMCRIRMFESYMRTDNGWDFTLFDHAFRSAEKYGVKVYATLFPETEKTDIGGWKFPADDTQKEQFARFIRNLVTHYKDHPALYGWVLINEPGIDKLPDTDFVNQHYVAWKKEHPSKDFKPNGYPILMETQKQEFHKDINSSFLHWIADEIKKIDSNHDIHVNTHAIFQNCAQYDFPRWRTFLTSLGGSAHAAWHFSYFDRKQYALAMLANAEIIRSGAGELPWFMTELQGGNNTYSGGQAMCPTPEEIRQWLWITVGCEGKGSIFWSFNPRSSGIESGEWAMINFQDKPSQRLISAGKTAEVFQSNSQLLSNLKLIPSGIDVLYFRESLWTEQLMAVGGDQYLARRPGAVMKSAIACFRALTELGLNVGFKEANEYDFSHNDYRGQSLLISHQIAIPSYYKEKLQQFVKKGGTLLVEGLSAFFDEDLHCTMNTGFMFQELFGGNISEFEIKENLFHLQIKNTQLPVHAWQGTIAFGKEDNYELIHENPYGKGKVIWLPSCVALGAWVSSDYNDLSAFLISKLPLSNRTISFDGHYDNLLMRTLTSGKDVVVICINKSGYEEKVQLRNIDLNRKNEIIYADAGCRLEDGRLIIAPEGILVLKTEN